MTFCQIVLKKKHVERVRNKPGDIAGGNKQIEEAVKNHIKYHPDDPLPFPFDDLDPNVYTPFSEKYPWHTQIHRDAFGYGEVPADIDQRLIVDLRFFGYIDPNEYNRITYSPTRRDGFGMLQVKFPEPDIDIHPSLLTYHVVLVANILVLPRRQGCRPLQSHDARVSHLTPHVSAHIT